MKLVYKLFVSFTIAISVRNSLEDKSMLFNQLYLTQGHKLEAWFVLSESREYFSVEPKISCQQIDKKVFATTKYFFTIY